MRSQYIDEIPIAHVFAREKYACLISSHRLELFLANHQ